MSEDLSPEKRLTQDSMTRATIKRALPKIQWQALVGKYSINQDEVRAAAAYLTPLGGQSGAPAIQDQMRDGVDGSGTAQWASRIVLRAA